MDFDLIRTAVVCFLMFDVLYACIDRWTNPSWLSNAAIRVAITTAFGFFLLVYQGPPAGQRIGCWLVIAAFVGDSIRRHRRRRSPTDE